MQSKVIRLTGPSWARPDLTLLASEAVQAPAFPRAVLGTEWDNWCAEISASANAPYDYVGASLLTTAAALIGNARVAAFGDWEQPSIMWTVLVGKPSAKKSPAMRPFGRHIADIEAELAEGSEDDGEPVQISVGNITERAAHGVAEMNPKGIFLYLDELSAWWQKTVGASGEGFWLSTYDGAPYSINRAIAGRARTSIPHSSASVLGGAQPDTIRDLVQAKSDRGFTSRWLYVYPEPTVGFVRPAKVDQTMVADAFRRLWRLELNGRHPSVCDLTAEAEAAVEDWLATHQPQTAAADGSWSQWLGKQDGMLLRYALILEHLWWAVDQTNSDSGPRSVSVDAIRAAASFIDGYAKPMAMRTFDIAARPQEERQAAFLARLLRRSETTTFNAREVRRNRLGPVGQLSDPAAMSAACGVLEAAQLIRHVGTRAGGTKGRVPETFEVNPRLFTVPVNN